MLAEIEEATASPVLSKSEEELLQLIREGIAYYDSLLESGRVDFLRETTSVASDGLPEMERAPSGTWKGTFEFSGRKMRCVVTRDAIQLPPPQRCSSQTFGLTSLFLNPDFPLIHPQGQQYSTCEPKKVLKSQFQINVLLMPVSRLRSVPTGKAK